MEQIAVISDIHGNLEALKVVLEDIETRNITNIICLGDIIGKGTHSKECIDLVKENATVCLMGNWEYNLFQENNSFLKNLSEEEKIYLKNRPHSYEMYISGNLVRFVHSSPTSFNDYVFSFSNAESKYNLFLPSTKTISQTISDILIYGHIHYQYTDTIYNRLLINTGAVGNSLCLIRDENRDTTSNLITMASYLILEGNLDSKEMDTFLYQFVKVPYGVSKELQDCNDIDLKNELLYGKYRDLPKLKKFLEK